MTDSTPAIEIRGLSHSYNRGKLEVLKDINLTFGTGFFGLLGANGAEPVESPTLDEAYLAFMMMRGRADAGPVRTTSCSLSQRPQQTRGYAAGNA